MAVLDLNEAGPQGSGVGIIPPDSMVVVRLHIDMPPQGKTGSLPEVTRSAQSTLEFLSTTLEVIEGKYKGAKIYHRFSLFGATSDKQKQAVNIAKNQLRAIVECARNIDANDASPQAAQARLINSLSEFESMTFPIKVGCEASNKAKKNDPTHYFVNNCLVKVVTKADGEYASLCQPPYELISALPVPEFPVEGGASSATQQNLWTAPTAQAQTAPASQPQTQGWGAPAAQQTPPPPTAAPSPAGSAAPSLAQPAPSTDQVPFN